MIIKLEKYDKLTAKNKWLIFINFLVTFLVLVSIFNLSIFIQNRNQLIEITSKFRLQYIISLVCIGLFLGMVYIYLKSFEKAYLHNLKKLCTILTTLCFCCLINFFIGIFINPYVRPYCLIVMLVAILLNRNVAVFMGIISVLLVVLYDFASNLFSLKFSNVFSTFIVGILSCILAVIFISRSAKRLSVVFTAIKLFFAIFFVASICQLMEGGDFSVYLSHIILYACSPILAALLYLAFLPVFERLFSIMTIYMLNELTDHTAPLLKRLFEEAPGTFNHCLMVSQLSEACALAIGENPHLARAAAYYHDVGKLKNPIMFKENQGEINVHDELTPELSTKMIKMHTVDGCEICKKYHLPEEICDIAIEHHGTFPIKYFYVMATKYSENKLNISDFCYDGPLPQSKIAAIIMIVDAAEAAVRSLTDRSANKVEELIRLIIEERMQLDQFDDCDITMKDIYKIKSTLVQNFAGIFHDRIEYPKIKLRREKVNK